MIDELMPLTTIAEPQTLNRAGREVLGEDVRPLRHLLDQSQAALVFEVDGQRALVGVVHHEIEGVAKAGTAGFAARRLHLGDVSTHPGERLGAGRAGLELRQGPSGASVSPVDSRASPEKTGSFAA